MSLKKLSIILILFFILKNSLFAKDEIIFVPLPTKKAFKTVKEFTPLGEYLKKEINLNIKYEYRKNYEDILNGFKDGSIDMAYLGPLPYIFLKKQYKYTEAIVTFKEKSGRHKYRCVLAKFQEDKIDLNKKIKIALTQPLSTCGFFMSKILLKQNFNKNLEKQLYEYTMSHENALIETLKGNYDLAGAKDSIAKKHKSLGMKIIAQSDLLPGFTLVLNKKTLSKEKIDEIQKTLLNTPKNIYSKWKGKASNGIVKTSNYEYDNLAKKLFFIPKKGNINE